MSDASSLAAWEAGELTEEGAIEMFQGLADSGEIWKMPRSYAEMAHALMMAGLIVFPDRDYYESQ